MDVLDILSNLRAAILEKINNIETTILSGIVSNWDSYKGVLGQRDALIGILNYLDSLIKRVEQ